MIKEWKLFLTFLTGITVGLGLLMACSSSLNDSEYRERPDDRPPMERDFHSDFTTPDDTSDGDTSDGDLTHHTSTLSDQNPDEDFTGVLSCNCHYSHNSRMGKRSIIIREDTKTKAMEQARLSCRADFDPKRDCKEISNFRLFDFFKN